jgi:hypothetical protein
LGVPLKIFPPALIELPDWSEIADYAATLLPPEKRTEESEGPGDEPGQGQDQG